jgi:lipoprotein-releasing system permease protein
MDAMRRAIEPAQQRPMIDTDWRQLNRSFFDVLAVESNVMFAILTLIVLVAALNIISGLIMLVQDKARAIAVLRTMGATRGAIMRIFLITGATIGFVGTAVGLVLGLLVAYNVEPIRKGLSWLTGANLFPFRILFPVATALAGRGARRACGCGDGALPLARCDDLSVLARGQARSGRGAAL